MNFNILTIFPEMFNILNTSIIGRAKEKGIIKTNFVNIRDFAEDKHKRVDFPPTGGGSGMLMKADVLKKALESLPENKRGKVVYLSPKGTVFTDKKALELSKNNNITFICGHYEGIDERFIKKYVDEEISIGDYCLTGGEIPAMVVIDAISRKIKGVLNEESLKEESHSKYLLEYSQYTLPRDFEGMEIPEILFSGNHEEIRKYRLKDSIKTTIQKRPDLIQKGIKENAFTKEELEIIEEINK